MSDELDSWFKSAFGVDLGASLDKITTAVAQVKKTASILTLPASSSGAIGSSCGAT